MTTNWKTPKSETMRLWERLVEMRCEEIRVQQPGLSNDEVITRALATAEIAALDEVINKELFMRLVEDAIDQDTFAFTTAAGKQMVIADEVLARMSDAELAAWVQKTGVIFAQVKAHPAERFPQTRFKIVS
jgi:hypothetical protein